MSIFIDGDACPVKDEVLRVAERHGQTVHLVSNRWLRGYDHPLVEKTVVADGMDAADDWIVAHIGPDDIAVTADILLAGRCLERQAQVLGPTGKPFTADSIGMAKAMRELSAQLRDSGDLSGGPAPFVRQDRSRFLSALENMVQAIRRRG
ncbi:MAG: YaiI/YqxD family protein [Azospirillaceae bacterium]|nr:YaiI/YqxD family protein [Azospirillaceae bacterium]